MWCEIRCMKGCEASFRMGPQWHLKDMGMLLWTSGWHMVWHRGSFLEAASQYMQWIPCSVCRSQTQAMQTRWGLLLPWGATSSFFPATSSHRSRNLHYPGRCLLPLILWKEQAGLPHFGARKYFFFPVTTETLIEFCLETFLQLFLSKCNYWSWWEFQCWLN